MACEESRKSFDTANCTLALHFSVTFHVNKSIYLLLNFNLNNILRKICQKSRDKGKEESNNNGKGGETPLKNSVKQNGNEYEKDEGTVQESEKGNGTKKQRQRKTERRRQRTVNMSGTVFLIFIYL